MSERRTACPPTLDQETGRELRAALRAKPLAPGDEVVIDFRGTRAMDSRGGAWLIEIADWVRERDATLRFENHQGAVARFVDLIQPGLAHSGAERPPRPGIAERVGDAAFAFGDRPLERTVSRPADDDPVDADLGADGVGVDGDPELPERRELGPDGDGLARLDLERDADRADAVPARE